jgi:hypothetical protein
VGKAHRKRLNRTLPATNGVPGVGRLSSDRWLPAPSGWVTPQRAITNTLLSSTDSVVTARVDQRLFVVARCGVA